MEKRELLGETKEKATAVIIKEFLQDGAKVQFNSMGETKGKYNGSHMETVDVFLKMDGTNEWEARGMDITKEGDIIMITGKGTGKQESATTGSFTGEVSYMTMSKRLAWLNSTKGWIEGKLDQRNNEAIIKAYAAKKPEVEVPAPM
jgi:hypothetical protein